MVPKPQKKVAWTDITEASILDPGLGLGLAAECLLTTYLPMGPSRTQPKQASQASPLLGSACRRPHKGLVPCDLGGGPDDIFLW